MSTAPLQFTGVSTYSNDLQSILSRAVSIAQIPLTRLQNQESDITLKKQLLTSLSGVVGGVGASLSALGTLAASKSLIASSSDSSKVSVVNSGATTAASYSITNITSVASAASETSLTGYATANATPVSSTGNVQLIAGSQTINLSLTPQTNNLNGLRDAINNANAGVTASILTTGTGANADYLTISANSTGSQALKLNDLPATGSPVNLLTNKNQGSNAVFTLNGLQVSRPTNTANDVVAGLTFSILGKTDPNQTVTLALSSDRGQLSSALQSFAANYNALVGQVNAQVGPQAGLLSGDFLITQVESDLHQAVSSTGSGAIKGIANLGLSLDTTGKITFDPGAVSSLTDSQLSDAFSFLGSSTTGFGALAAKFNQLSDPNGGLIKVQQDGYDRSVLQINGQINVVNDHVSALEKSLNAKLQAADAAIAQLQSQQNVVTASVQSVDLALYGKNYGSALAG